MDFSIPESALAGLEPEEKNKSNKRAYKEDSEHVFKIKLTAENNFTYKAKLRLLYKPGSPQAMVKTMRHFFSNPIPGAKDNKGKQKFWTTSALCPKTFGLKCPICDNAWAYKDLHKKTGDKRFEKLHTDRLPSISYLTNVYIINDESNEKNNGTVKVWYVSAGLYKKVQALMYPKTVEIDDDEFSNDEVKKINPFHPIEGVNMMLISNHDDKGWQSYENTKFGKVVPLADDEGAINAILEQCHDLESYVNKDTLKSFDELAQALKVHDERTGLTEITGEVSVVEDATDGPELEISSNHKRSVNKPIEGDSDIFFGDDELDDDEFSMPSAPIKQPTATSTKTSKSSSSVFEDDDDDDLPF